MLCRQLRSKVILRRAGEVSNPGKMPVLLQAACAPCHDIRIQIDGIDGIGDSHAAVPAEDFLDIAAVALGAVADKDFIRAEFQPVRLIIRRQDSPCQEIIALLRAVAAESLSLPHLRHGLLHGFYANLRQRPGNIAYPQADYISLRMLLLISCHTAAYFRKEVAAGQFQVIVIDCRHILFLHALP